MVVVLVAAFLCWGSYSQQVAALRPRQTSVQEDVDWPFPFWNPNLTIAERVNDLVGRLTLEDKVNQMSYGGASAVGSCF